MQMMRFLRTSFPISCDCEKNNIECYVAIPRKFSNESIGMYGLGEFAYDQATDTYLCPQNKEMTFRSTYINGNRTLRRYECSECHKYQFKKKCTSSKGNSYISRSEFEEVMEGVKERMKANREILKIRSKTDEHIFGTMKQWPGYGGGFLLKGLKKVNGEFSLISLVNNMKRAIKIMGMKKLIESLAAS